jgi:hypothetical protein
VDPYAQQFSIVRSDGDTAFLVTERRENAIWSGDASNRLELTCSGSTITARINETEVASVQDSRLQDGALGFAAAGATVYFDNLVIRQG